MPRSVIFGVESYDSDRFLHQLWIVHDFLRSLWYYRELERQMDDMHRVYQFFPYSSKAHRHQAAIAWCKVFGSPKSNYTHFHELAADARDSFRSGFEAAVGRSLADYESYQRRMLEYRNKYVAHTEAHFGQENIPDFAFALDVAFYWDDWARNLIRPDSVEAPALRLYAEILQKQVAREVGIILQHLPNSEKVGRIIRNE